VLRGEGSAVTEVTKQALKSERSTRQIEHEVFDSPESSSWPQLDQSCLREAETEKGEQWTTPGSTQDSDHPCHILLMLKRRLKQRSKGRVVSTYTRKDPARQSQKLEGNTEQQGPGSLGKCAQIQAHLWFNHTNIRDPGLYPLVTTASSRVPFCHLKCYLGGRNDPNNVCTCEKMN
jgi:hypothetical protein